MTKTRQAYENLITTYNEIITELLTERDALEDALLVGHRAQRRQTIDKRLEEYAETVRKAADDEEFRKVTLAG